jgi:hypothetical protein
VPGAQVKTVTRTGPVRAWRMDADGTLYVQLGQGTARISENETEGRPANGQSELIWFCSPPTQTTTRDFENMLIQILIATKDESSELTTFTIVGEEDRGHDGTTIEGAHKILHVGS